ncbi:hypothetical protein ACVNNN_20095 [Lysinibacillus fusiformis]|uniref:hypothetical protein n=1 Tax=Lysinibacillus sp. PWR01 TaxID=3342384 RepID=UPI00372D0D8D
MTIYDEKLLKTVPVPPDLTDRHVALAQQYTRAKMLEGHTIAGFCKSNRISTNTWYDFLDIPSFIKYMADIQNLVIPADEKDAFQQMKKHILKIPYKENPTIKETELFMDVFGYLAENDKRIQMERLGLTKTSSGTSNAMSVEERKTQLLGRLMKKG